MLKNDRFYTTFRPFGQWNRAQSAIKLIAFAVVFVSTIQTAAAIQRVQAGVVMRVVDGDTLWLEISDSRQALKVRIQGIDAPEICQPGGVQARQALKRRVLGQSVTVTSSAHDDHGRSVGILRLDGQDMGRWLVSQGHAWVDSRYQKKRSVCRRTEAGPIGTAGRFQ